MFPCIEKYIHAVFTDRNTQKPMVLSDLLEKELQKNAREVLKLHKMGINIIFPNVLEIEKN